MIMTAIRPGSGLRNNGSEEHTVQAGKASLGFGGEKMIPLIEGNSGDFQISLFLRPEEPAAVYPEPKARKLKKKLPRKGRVECCVVYTPLPRSDEYKCEGYEDRFCTFFLGVNTKKGGEYLLIDLFAGYIDAADEVLDCIIGGFEAKKFIPEEIDVVDERTEKLLGDFCSSNGIRLVRTDHFTEFDEVRDQVIEDMASPDDEEEMSDTDRFENVCDMLYEMSEREISQLPDDLYQLLIAFDELPDDLRAKLRRAKLK